MSKQYINEYGNLIDEEGRYVKRHSSKINPSIVQEGYFYFYLNEDELMIEEELNTDSKLYLKHYVL